MRALAVVSPPSRLDELEAVVRAGQDAFLSVGRALVEIRDLEVYREAGYASFGAYLAERFPELSRRSVYNALAAATVADDLDGFSTQTLGTSHLVELARLGAADRRHMADLAAARNLSVRELRELIRELQRSGTPRRPAIVPDIGGIGGLPAECRIEVRDCRTLVFEDGIGHLERRHGAPCDDATCPHPALVLESPPYNAGVAYDDDPTADCLSWREYWHELIVPHFREVYRVLMPGGRFAVNLANVLRSDAGDRRRGDGDGARHHRPYRLEGIGKRQHAGMGGDGWAVMIDRLIWTTWSRIGFLPRERFTWIKTSGEADANSQSNKLDPANTITTSTAWGTYGSPANPVARAVAEPIFVASKSSHQRQHSRYGNSESIDGERFKALTRNAWFIPNNVDRSRHPCPWPRGVPDNLVELYTWPGDLVVNPFVGSGTSAESAIELGRRFYGADQSQTYVHDAERRAAAALARLEGVQV